MQTFEFKSIAVVRSDYHEKFTIPRQPGLAPAARARLEVSKHWVERGALDGLQQASHLWLQFIFHGIKDRAVSGRVRPPRLGGNKKMGVFATRSTHRPNPIGLSVVRLLSVEANIVHIGGADLLDGTPVLDIKPYLPWSDCIADAQHELAGVAPPYLAVAFSERAELGLASLQPEESERVRALLQQSLGQDPRPAYQRSDSNRIYGVRIAHCEVSWRHRSDGAVEVLSVEHFS